MFTIEDTVHVIWEWPWCFFGFSATFCIVRVSRKRRPADLENTYLENTDLENADQKNSDLKNNALFSHYDILNSDHFSSVMNNIMTLCLCDLCA